MAIRTRDKTKRRTPDYFVPAGGKEGIAPQASRPMYVQSSTYRYRLLGTRAMVGLDLVGKHAGWKSGRCVSSPILVLPINIAGRPPRVG